MHILKTPPARLLPALAVLALLLATLPGCAHMPGMLGGSGDTVLVLDGDQAHEATVQQGHLLILDMRNPSASGYVFAGTSFDPEMLRLDGIVQQPGGRVRYQFMATDRGASDIQIKIRKDEPGYRPDVYKRVRVTIEQQPGGPQFGEQ